MMNYTSDEDDELNLFNNEQPISDDELNLFDNEQPMSDDENIIYYGPLEMIMIDNLLVRNYPICSICGQFAYWMRHIQFVINDEVYDGEIYRCHDHRSLFN